MLFEDYSGVILYRGPRDIKSMESGLPGMHFTRSVELAKLAGKIVSTYMTSSDINIIDFYSDEALPIINMWGTDQQDKIHEYAKIHNIDGVDYNMGDAYGVVIFNHGMDRVKELNVKKIKGHGSHTGLS